MLFSAREKLPLLYYIIHYMLVYTRVLYIRVVQPAIIIQIKLQAKPNDIQK